MAYLALIFTFWDGQQVQSIHLADYQANDCYEIAQTLNEHSNTGVGYTCEESK